MTHLPHFFGFFWILSRLCLKLCTKRLPVHKSLSSIKGFRPVSISYSPESSVLFLVPNLSAVSTKLARDGHQNACWEGETTNVSSQIRALGNANPSIWRRLTWFYCSVAASGSENRRGVYGHNCATKFCPSAKMCHECITYDMDAISSQVPPHNIDLRKLAEKQKFEHGAALTVPEDFVLIHPTYNTWRAEQHGTPTTISFIVSIWRLCQSFAVRLYGRGDKCTPFGDPCFWLIVQSTAGEPWLQEALGWYSSHSDHEEKTDETRVLEVESITLPYTRAYGIYTQSSTPSAPQQTKFAEASVFIWRWRLAGKMLCWNELSEPLTNTHYLLMVD